jgi:hypothetical protein
MWRLGVLAVLVVSFILMALFMRQYNTAEPLPRKSFGPRYCVIHRQPIAYPLPPLIHCKTSP